MGNRPLSCSAVHVYSPDPQLEIAERNGGSGPVASSTSRSPTRRIPSIELALQVAVDFAKQTELASRRPRRVVACP